MQDRRQHASPEPPGDRFAGRYVLAVGLAAAAFVTLLFAFAVESYPRWRGPEYALFAVPAVLLAAAVVSGLGWVLASRDSDDRSGDGGSGR